MTDSNTPQQPERADATLSFRATARKQQRLVVCLDGTWNNRDDTTNVVHHFAFALDGDRPSNNSVVTQMKYYHEGVGTGVLDGITGGAFGFGLEKNVREAYDWLVEQYHDADDQVAADEIYIFGFSRGAYTARSLVGFIATFGLLRHGAPLSVNQLWEDYCILGREREHRTGFWDKLFGEAPVGIRRIWDLIMDPWNIKWFERKRATGLSDSHRTNGGRVPGQLVDDLNLREWLLIRWSRRVQITYLGVYDTVGAMGIDALAIPGVRSKLAMHNNMRATSLVQHCRHALALDEHRPSFSHTPFLEYRGHAADTEDNQRAAMQATHARENESTSETREKTAEHWMKAHDKWRQKIEQRWFVGAHSNIGGGYPDNALAQRPLQWLVDGAREIGLGCEAFSFSNPHEMPAPRDSFAEFASPYWMHVIRGKRHYRPVDPKPDIFARPTTKHSRKTETGYSLLTINEQVDDSVLNRFVEDQIYRPPNLIEFANRKREDPAAAHSAELKSIAKERPRHPWFGETISAHIWLVLWATLAAAGLMSMRGLFFAQTDWRLPPWTLAAAAFISVLVDWGESRANFSLALGPSNASWRAFLDSLYWVRTLGFILFVCGTTAALAYLLVTGWNADRIEGAWKQGLSLIKAWWSVPLAAAASVAFANLLDRAPAKRQGIGIFTLLVGPALVLCFLPIVALSGSLLHKILAPLLGHPRLILLSPAPEARFAGILLLLQIAFVFYLKAFTWVGEPTSRRNLGSIFSLQRRCTPNGVAACFERWRTMLSCTWSKDDDDVTNGPAARSLRDALREALWRDMLGYIPLYLIVLGFGLWFGAKELGWYWLDRVYRGIPFWALPPLVAATADYIEDFCHMRYIRLHEQAKKPSFPLAIASFTATILKFAAFLAAAGLTIAALGNGAWKVGLFGEGSGWRGTVTLTVSIIAFAALLIVPASAVIYRRVAARGRGSGSSHART
jgi:uncharacterized protein (DUF2235 family)